MKRSPNPSTTDNYQENVTSISFMIYENNYKIVFNKNI